MRILLTVLVVLLVLLQVQLWREYRAVSDLRELVEHQAAENRRLRTRNEALAAEVADLRAGLDAVEERARAELGLIREGETFYLVVSPEDLDPEQLERARRAWQQRAEEDEPGTIPDE